MKIVINNLFEIFLFVGISCISIGVFLYSLIIGFVVTGLMFLGVSYLLFKGGG